MDDGLGTVPAVVVIVPRDVVGRPSVLWFMGDGFDACSVLGVGLGTGSGGCGVSDTKYRTGSTSLVVGESSGRPASAVSGPPGGI